MSYTKRTCSKCGYRDIQPNMKQVTESYTSGQSQRQISKRSIIGAFLGEPRAQRQNADWLFGSTRRKYTRNRTVWVCRTCPNLEADESFKLGGNGIIGKIFAGLFQLMLMCILLVAIILIFG